MWIWEGSCKYIFFFLIENATTCESLNNSNLDENCFKRVCQPSSIASASHEMALCKRT